MAKYSPQTNYFNIAKKIDSFEKGFVFIVTILSIMATIFLEGNSLLSMSLVVISAVGVFVFDYYLDQYQHMAESVRRKSFIDNSFGSKMLSEESEGYYDNDELEKGLYKALINIYENSLFSYNIAKKMQTKSTIRNLIWLAFLLGFAIIGFAKCNFAAAILQLYLSKYYLQELVTIRNYVRDIKEVYDRIQDLFDDTMAKEQLEKGIPHPKEIYCLIEYESNISWYKLFLDSKLYNKMNEPLTKEWEQIKKRYQISTK